MRTPPRADADEGKGARTRTAILEAAVRAFRREGYDGATLAGIAEELGVTRSAVLHHFPSKAALLREIVTPFLASVDTFLDRIEGQEPLTPRARRRLMTEVVDVTADHRQVAALLTVDVAVHVHLGPDLQIADRAQRFVAITSQRTDHAPLAAVRSLAALGSVVRPLAASDDLVDLDDPATRELLVAAALAVLRTPLPVSPRSGPSRARGGA